MSALGIEYALSSSDEEEEQTELMASASRSQDEQQHQHVPLESPHLDTYLPTESSTTGTDATGEIASLPPEPSSAADPEVQVRIARFLAMQQQDRRVPSFQENLRAKKEVANPYILSNVVQYFGIDELHSNFASDVFDPHGLPLTEYVDQLAVAQRQRMQARMQQQANREHIDFVAAKQTE